MIRCTPITASCGAEVSGVSLRAGLSPEEARSLRAALLTHKVLVLRDQHPSPSDQIRLGQALGTLAPRHPLYPKVDGHDDIIVIRDDASSPPENEVWHADLSCYPSPPFAAVLHGAEIPPVGGDTLWVNMAAVAASLSPPMQRFLEGLTALHTLEKGFDFLDPVDQADRIAALTASRGETHRADHPVLRRHPLTGEPVLYVNASFTVCVNELHRAESKQLLSFLCSLAEQPRYQMRLRWSPGTVVVWDNWATQHFAAADHFPATREVHRVTVQRPH